jgi:carbamoyltransferase
MRVVGISAFYHDGAAAMVADGEFVAAAQEERFTRKKHDSRFPRHALEYCLAEAGIGLDQVDLVAFYDKPLLKFERLLETYLAFAPRGYEEFKMAIPVWLREKLVPEGLAAEPAEAAPARLRLGPAPDLQRATPPASFFLRRTPRPRY